MLEILTRITQGEGVPEDIDKLKTLGARIKEASLCGLGQTAPNPVLTTLRYFSEEYEAHIRDRRCPAGSCTALVDFLIDPAKCTGCTLCVKACPVGAIAGERKSAHTVDTAKCVKCGKCITVCTFGAVYKK
jgi:Fe-S-cluster-containing hydrogenase component 2